MKPEKLERHLARQPFRALPADWREGILAAARAEAPAAPARTRSSWGTALREIFWPAPRLWAAIGCAWGVMIALSAILDPSSPSPSPSAPALGWSLRQQQKLLAELASPAGREATEARPAREALPGRPRSELNSGSGRG